MLERAENRYREYSQPEEFEEKEHSWRRAFGVVGVREIFGLIWRKRIFIFTIVIISFLLTLLAVSSMRDIYSARSVLVLERNETRMLEAVTQIQSGVRDRVAVETEMDIIASRIFVGRVIDQMKLIEDPWYNSYLDPDAASEQSGANAADDARPETGYIQGAIDAVRREISSFVSPAGKGPLPSIAVQRDRVITKFLSNMEVTRNRESLAISVRVSSPDPELSAQLANAVSRLYVDWSRDTAKQSMSDAVRFLRERATAIAKRIATNERSIAQLVQKHQLAVGSRDDVLRQRIDGLNTQLTQARGELAGIRAQKEQALQIMSGEEHLEGAGLESQHLTSLRGEQARLMREKAQFSSNFGSSHPALVKTDAELASVNEMINVEIQRILEELSGEEKIISGRQRQLEMQISEAQDILHERSLAEIRLRELERDVQADQKLHDLVLQRLGNLDPFSEIAKASARVVSHAEVPRSPSFPNKSGILIGGVIGFSVLAVIAAAVLEAIDTRIRSGSQIGNLIQQANLANVPRVKKPWLSVKWTLLGDLIRHPRSPFAESLRSLYLAFRAQYRKEKSIVLFTAPLPKSGTTSVALGFSISAARHGAKTVYVNLGPRFPERSALGLGGVPSTPAPSGGTGAAKEPAEPVREVPGLFVVDFSHSRGEGQYSDVLATSDHMQRFLADLNNNYELVVVDCAPALIVEDANWLSPFVDAVVLVTHFRKTKESELYWAAARLRINKAPLVGTVLTLVDPKALTEDEPLGAMSYPRAAKAYFDR